LTSPLVVNLGYEPIGRFRKSIRQMIDADPDISGHSSGQVHTVKNNGLWARFGMFVDRAYSD
jgi:hypothetical protein